MTFGFRQLLDTYDDGQLKAIFAALNDLRFKTATTNEKTHYLLLTSLSKK